jgi:phosphoserine phosphatase RsbU/P
MTEPTQEQLLAEIKSLREQVAELKTEKSAFEAQTQLIEHLVSMARSSTEQELLKAALKDTLDLSRNLTEAERGSLFLLDHKGAISASLLTRKDATAEESTALIGIVLDKGLAGWVSRTTEIGLILDTEKDNRWINLPNQPYIVRSALALPIIKAGTLLGILTLLHSEPEHFTIDHAHLMEVTAEQIALALENVQLYAQLEKTKKALQNELEKGRQIQLDFLPEKLLQVPEWELAACFYPAKQVAGDFYDAFLLPSGHVGLVIADVCDKGVGAALFMALFRSLIRIFSGQISLQTSDDKVYIEPLKAVELTNNYIAMTHSAMAMFATMFFAILDPKTGLMTYVNGGHEYPIIIGKNGGIKIRLKPTGPAVGAMPNVRFKVQEYQFERGEMLISYTDGVPEAHSPDGSFFTDKRLFSLVEPGSESVRILIDKIESELRQHIADRDQFDDITMLGIKWLSNDVI